MLLAMCADTGMLISVLVFLIIGAALCVGLFVLAMMIIVKLVDAARRQFTSASLSDANLR